MERLPYTPIDPALRTRADQAFGEATRGGGTLLDAANILGNKERAIKNLLDRLPSIGSTLDANGKFDIPWNERAFAGINDDDIAKALVLRDERQRVTSPLGQQARKLGVDFNASTKQSSLENKVEEAGYVKELSKSLNELGPEGALALTRLKKNGNLSSDSLLSENARVKKEINDKNPDVINARAAQQQSITASKAAIAGAEADRSFQKSQALVANQMAERTAAFQESQATFQQNQAAEQSRNRWQDKREARREDALTREMNAENNAMQMQLEYSRLAQADATRAQDRKDKAIMALLGGLGNLGAAFTI